MTSTLTKTRPCRLAGGPYDGWNGEFLDTDQRLVFMGPDGGQSFAYKRSQRPPKKDRPVVFRFDKATTRIALQAAGVSAELIDIATADPADIPVNLPSDGREEPLKVKLDVRVERRGTRRWVMIVDGEEVAGRVDLEDTAEAAQAWVKSVLFPEQEDSDAA